MKVSIGRYPKNGNDQKVKVQIDKWDTWNMDCTLAHIIHPMLVQLKATKHGAPNVDDCDVIKFLLNNNWLFINNYYTEDQLDELRAKVIPLVDVGVNQTDFPMRSFIDEYFKSRGCCST